MENKRMPHLCDNTTCTGCSACFNACPVGAISMQPDSIEGFYRPAVDSEKCIKCLKCEDSCPIINPVQPHAESDSVFAAWHLDEDIRRTSSSGGAFSALAQSVLDENGIVIGASYDDDLNLSHIAIEAAGDLKKLRASKYFQSYVGDSYKKAIEYLKAGRKVLFCGTPCQIAGFRSFLGNKQYDNLILVDFVCHGVPSPNYFKAYLNWIEEKYGKIKYFSFRNKNKGWYDALRVAFGAKTTVMKGKYDAYWVGFNGNLCLQEACYDCHFLGKKRNSDITIGDFWGIGKSIPFGHKSQIEKGVSMIIVNTSKGSRLLDAASSRLEMYQRSMEEVITGNMAMIKPSFRPKVRDEFYKDLNTKKFDELRIKYLEPSLKGKLVKIIRERMPKRFVEYLRIRLQK